MEKVQSSSSSSAPVSGIEKAPTGILGFDEITGGGLPAGPRTRGVRAGRPTLVCGAPGCGKTLFAMQSLVAGATRFGEPGVFMSFEEPSDDLAKNVASLGFDLDDLTARGLISMDTVSSSAARSRRAGSTTSRGCSCASTSPS